MDTIDLIKDVCLFGGTLPNKRINEVRAFLDKAQALQLQQTGVLIAEHISNNLKTNKVKKETLEEVAERLYPFNPYSIGNGIKYDKYAKERRCFIEGAKWQQERMYSEEEVKFILSEALQSALVQLDLEQWFEQFKKK